MALADPQSIKIGASTISLPRTDSSGTSGVYTSEDGLTVFSAANQNGKRKRQTARVDVEKIIASTLLPSQNEEASMSCYIVFDRPASGYSNTEALDVYKGLVESLGASEYKVLKAILGGQS